MSSPPGATVPTTTRKQSLPGSFPSPLSTIAISSQQSLAQAVYERRAEYTVPHKIRIKVGTWNVASLIGTEKDIGGWFVEGKGISDALTGLTVSADDDPVKDDNKNSKHDKETESITQQEQRRSKKQSTIPINDPGTLPGGGNIGLYILGLQEIVDIGSATEALRPYTDPHPSRKWKSSIAEALPKGYELVAEQQLIGLLLLVYASPSVAPNVTSVSTTSVGTGLMGYMGNKGAVTARIILGETTRMVFINCHLAAGTEKGSVERRNWDAAQIISRTRFDPIQVGAGVVEEYREGIGDEDFAFWFGDLNYRLNTLAGDDVRRLLMLHTRNEYDTKQSSLRKIDNELEAAGMQLDRQGQLGRGSEDSNTSSQTDYSRNMYSTSVSSPNGDEVDQATDPTSLQTTLSSILPHDQLHEQMRLRRAFHDGWREGAINFLPTYKYDVGSVGMFDSSEKRRGPSWCDRILYRTRKDRLKYLKAVHEEEEARRKDAEMTARGLDKSTGDEVLYDYDPDVDGADSYEENVNNGDDTHIVVTKAGYEDKLKLDYYTSHQRVLSSDHKPLDAIFTLDYDAVDSGLKASVHQEVARALDKAENEGRPVITIVVDPNPEHNSNPDESVNFGDVRYDVPKTRSLTIANTGRVPATFGFVDRHIGGIAPPWLEIRFDRQSDNHNPNLDALHEYTLEPGDATNVELTILITNIEQVRDLNEGRSKVEEVLVLRVTNGPDHFLPVRGMWLQSSYGRSLDKLLEDGVRKLQHQKPAGSRQGDKDEPVISSAPRAVLRLTEAIEELMERATAERDMRGAEASPPWNNLGWPFVRESWSSTWEDRHPQVESIRESLDLGHTIHFHPMIETVLRVEALAETLVTLLDGLEGGVVREELWQELSKGADEKEKMQRPFDTEEMCSWVLDILSTYRTSCTTFTILVFMVARVANEIAPLRSVLPTPSTPQSPDALLGRTRRFSEDPVMARRQEVERKYADTFANVMIKAPLPLKLKDRAAAVARRRQVIEVFLRSRWEEGM